MNKARWPGLQRFWQARRADAAAITVILLFFALFFWPAVFDGKLLIAGDSLVYSYPLRTVAWNEIRRGALPLWTPLLMSGYPLLSMSHLGLGYPLTWGYLFLPGPWAEQVYVLVPFLLAPAFTYAYAREINRSRMGSLLAGFAYGYGGLMASALANNGMLTNAQMWLPLMLIWIERARTQPFTMCLLWAGGAYTMSVLTGVGQGFVYVGMLAFAYAAFTGATYGLWGNAETDRALKKRLDWRRWKPLFVAVGAAMMAAGIAAFQILETLRAARRSVRSRLSYEAFSEGSFPLSMAGGELVAPLFYQTDVTTYAPPLALCLAIIGVAVALGRRWSGAKQTDGRVLFWSATAVIAWLLILGSNTPLYRLIYYVPVLNRFRVPSRHTFEWTFAVGILAAYGWDTIRTICLRRSSSRQLPVSREAVVGVILLTLCIVVGGSWWWAAEGKLSPSGAIVYTGLSRSSYVLYKVLFTLLVVAAVRQGWRVGARGWRVAMLTAVITVACFVEPFILISRWWFPSTEFSGRSTAVSSATRFLQRYPPEHNRVYTRVDFFSETFTVSPRLDAHNLTALHGLHNLAGYEPLFLERYSRALSNVNLDAVNPRPGFAPNYPLFESQSHVLDLLNTTFVVTYANFATAPDPLIMKDGVGFAGANLSVGVQPGQTGLLNGALAEGDTLALVSSLANSGNEIDGSPVAKLRIFTVDDRVIERELRAGVDTAEWAHERADVRATARHSLAPVFESRTGDAESSFQSHSYWTRISLGEQLRVDRVEISNLSPSASLAIWKATLYDSTGKQSTPLPPFRFDHKRWQIVYDKDDVLILRNERALPRAWLVAEAEAVDGEEALKRIRGESQHGFDPRRTALLEVPLSELPTLPGGMISAAAAAQVVEYEANRLVIETTAETPAVLVVSEMNYPGWMASVDGKTTPIHGTNFVLRGVAVPAGRHRVEMRYTAPAARNGALISVFTLFVTGGVAIYARRTSTR